MKLLTRDKFRESVFERDKGLCVICKNPGQDAHHIIERRLFSDGGYYIDNGVTLCGVHHIEAETTELSCENIREAAGIEKVVLPEDFYRDHQYTKWGDVMMMNGQIMKGPLFYDESVQKILKSGPNFGLYTDYVKYPRSYHLLDSPGITKDDRVLKDYSNFEGKEVVVTLKMDGENTSIYKDYIHARSIDGRNHDSRAWVKNLAANIGWQLDEGWRICGENMFAKHSIRYDDLETYFYVFSIWNERNICLSWEETVEYCNILGLTTVPVLYKGIWDKKKVLSLWNESKRDTMEGFVVRNACEFPYKDFSKNLGKFVRAGHVQPESHHWFSKAIEKNILKK